MEATKNKNLALFLGINTFAAVAGLVFLFVYQLEGWPMTLITSYFMAVIGAYITVYVIRPKVGGGIINKRTLWLIMLALTLVIVVFLAFVNAKI